MTSTIVRDFTKIIVLKKFRKQCQVPFVLRIQIKKAFLKKKKKIRNVVLII